MIELNTPMPGKKYFSFGLLVLPFRISNLNHCLRITQLVVGVMDL